MVPHSANLESGARPFNAHARTPSPPPNPQADLATLSGKHAKACLLGEGWGEGGFKLTSLKYRGNRIPGQPPKRDGLFTFS